MIVTFSKHEQNTFISGVKGEDIPCIFDGANRVAEVYVAVLR
jgi:hypothetical protein